MISVEDGGEEQREYNVVPREVLKWLQSLDLAYSIRHVKRDFSNGFLAAEVLSRYFPKDIQMHSFDNGTSVDCKKTNWQLLIKSLDRIERRSKSHKESDEQSHKVQLKIDQQEMNDIIHCDSTNTTIQFLVRLYEHLTERKIQKVIKRDFEARKKSYEKVTTSSFVRRRLRSGQFTETLDEHEKQKKILDSVSEFERSVHEERSEEMKWFHHGSALSNGSPSKGTVGHGSPRVVDKTEQSVLDHFPVKEIHVKQFEAKIHTDRLPRDRTQTKNTSLGRSKANAARTATVTAPSLSPQMATKEETSSTACHASTQFNKTANDMDTEMISLAQGDDKDIAFYVLLTTIIYNTVHGSSSSWGEQGSQEVGDDSQKEGGDKKDATRMREGSMARMECLREFVWNLSPQGKDDDSFGVFIEVFERFADHAKQFAAMIADKPSLFTGLALVLFRGLETFPPVSDVYVMIARVMTTIGYELKQVDEEMTTKNVFLDQCVSRVGSIVRSHPQKAESLMRMSHAFLSGNASHHLAFLQVLRQKFDDLHPYILCLSGLTSSGEAFATYASSSESVEAQRAIVDIYMYYSHMGMCQEDPTIQAASIGMLAMISPADESHLERCYEVLDRTWRQPDGYWECQCQIVAVLGVMLRQLVSMEKKEDITTTKWRNHFTTFMDQVIADGLSRSVYVRESICSWFEDIVGARQPAENGPYMLVWLSLPAHRQGLLLSRHQDSFEIKGRYQSYRIGCLCQDETRALSGLRMITGNIISSGCDKLSTGHLLYLDRLGEHLRDHPDEATVASIWPSLASIEEYILVEVSDPRHMSLSMNLFSWYLSALCSTPSPPQQDSLTKICGALGLVFAQGLQTVQGTSMLQYLSRLKLDLDPDSPLSRLYRDLMTQFQVTFRDEAEMVLKALESYD